MYGQTVLDALASAHVTMRSSPLLLTALICATMLWSPCEAYYMYGTERRMGGKLCYLTRELVMDVESKIRAVQTYRDQYYKALQYQLGDTMYHLRNFFRMQVRIFQMAHRDVYYDVGHYHTLIESLIQIQRMAMEIETKVKMVQAWQYKRESKDEHHERLKDPLRMGAPRHDDDDEHEPLREVAARARVQRVQRGGAGSARVQGGAPRPRPPLRAPRPPPRASKKWRHVSDKDFQRMRL